MPAHRHCGDAAGPECRLVNRQPNIVANDTSRIGCERECRRSTGTEIGRCLRERITEESQRAVKQADSRIQLGLDTRCKRAGLRDIEFIQVNIGCEVRVDIP